MSSEIEQHYHEHKRKYMKRLTARAGTEWDAEDILHDAYERALRYADSFKDKSLDAWFNTIVNNALRDHKAAERGRPVSFEEEETEGSPCQYFNERTIEELYRRIDKRSGSDKEILSLHFKQEYSAIDISRITDYNYSNCRSVIKRFRDELKGRYTN